MKRTIDQQEETDGSSDLEYLGTIVRTCNKRQRHTFSQNHTRTRPTAKASDRSSGSPFTYSPLDHGLRSIRLVRVLPERTKTNLLRCEIRHADVSSTYSCLSYVWGFEQATHRIIMNERSLRVRPNLLNFLLYAASKHLKTSFWIDALCIDQHNVAERNHQVQQMGLIFSEAKEVFAWLGTDRGIARFLADPQTSGSRFHAFWSSPYWDRAWITQEIALASKVTLVARRQKLDMARVPFFRQKGNTDAVDLSRLSDLNPATTHTLKGKSLISLLHKFRFKECETPRDRIYSLLALCGEGSDVKVDYSIPPEDLAAEILSSCHRSLCLCAARTVGNVLGISENSPFSSIAGLPFVDVDVPSPFGNEPLTTLPSRITIDLSKICAAYNGTLEVTVNPTGVGLSFGYRERWGSFVTTTRGGSACTARLTDNGLRITLSLSLVALLNIARLARLVQFGDGVCMHKNVFVLRLHDPEKCNLFSLRIAAWQTSPYDTYLRDQGLYYDQIFPNLSTGGYSHTRKHAYRTALKLS